MSNDLTKTESSLFLTLFFRVSKLRIKVLKYFGHCALKIERNNVESRADFFGRGSLLLACRLVMTLGNSMTG